MHVPRWKGQWLDATQNPPNRQRNSYGIDGSPDQG